MKHILLSLISALALSSCGSTSVIRGNSIIVQGGKLRKTSAYRTQILQAGEKARGGTNYFSSFDFIDPAGKVVAKATTALTVDEVKTWLLNLGISNIPKVTGPDVKTSGGSTEAGTYVVVAVQNKKPLLAALQAKENKAIVQRLSQMKSPRIITAVATTLNHKSAHNVELNGSATVPLELVGAGTGDAKIEGKYTSKSTINFSDGTVFAYEISIPAWQRDTEGNLYIVDYVEDRPSWKGNTKPIAGSYLKVSKAPAVPKEQIILVD